MSRATTCRFHCSACHGHFSSLNAFDCHRTSHAEDRHCLEPLDDDRFAALSEAGVCSMYAMPRVGVTVWTLAADLERARERSGGSLRRPPGPKATGYPCGGREAA
jgi:hypothetical protein